MPKPILERIPIAGYLEEQRAFTSILKPDCKSPVIFLKGQKGMGKTTLLSVCKKSIPQKVNLDVVFFDGLDKSINLEKIVDQLSDLQKTKKSHTNKQPINNFFIQVGYKNKMSYVGQTPIEQADILFKKTDEWFKEYNKLRRNLLVVFDNYHTVSPEVRDWAEKCLLRKVEEIKKLRVVIAGEDVPELPNFVWGEYCEKFDLKGVLDAKEWMSVVSALEKRVPDEHPTSYLHAVCDFYNGHPGDIRTFIQGFEYSD
jgi:hypothetical protein